MSCLLDCKSLNFPRENVHLLGVIIDLLMPDSSVFQIYVNVHQAKKFCGRPSSLPIILKFNYNLIYVYFHSWKSRGAPGPGFNLTYLHVAGELLTGTSFLYQILLQEKVFPAKESQTSRSSLPKQLQNLWLFCWADLDFDILWKGNTLSCTVDSLKHFEISVLRHIRFSALRKIQIAQPNFTNEYVIILF